MGLISLILIFYHLYPYFIEGLTVFFTNYKIIIIPEMYKKRGALIDAPFFNGPENLMKPEFHVTFKTGIGLRSN
jgi:hypothetical protein